MLVVLIEIIGWVGTLLVLAAYLLLSLGRISGTSAAFRSMNALGAVFCMVNTWWHGAIPSMVLNIVWAVIGFVGLVRGRGAGESPSAPVPKA